MIPNIQGIASDVNDAAVKKVQAPLRVYRLPLEREFIRGYKARLAALHGRNRVDGCTSEQLRDALKIKSKCGPLWKCVVARLRQLGYRRVYRGRVGAQVRVWGLSKKSPPFRDIDAIRAYYRLIGDTTLFYEAYRKVHYNMRGERAKVKDLNFLRTQVGKDAPYRTEYKMLRAVVRLFADAVDCDEDDTLLRQEKMFAAFYHMLVDIHRQHGEACDAEEDYYPFSIKSMHIRIVCFGAYTITRRTA